MNAGLNNDPIASVGDVPCHCHRLLKNTPAAFTYRSLDSLRLITKWIVHNLEAQELPFHQLRQFMQRGLGVGRWRWRGWTHTEKNTSWRADYTLLPPWPLWGEHVNRIGDLNGTAGCVCVCKELAFEGAHVLCVSLCVLTLSTCLWSVLTYFALVRGQNWEEWGKRQRNVGHSCMLANNYTV